MSIFPSTLIISPQPDPEVQKLLTQLSHQSITNNPDILFIDQPKLESLRSIFLFLSQKPINHPTKIVIIPNAQNLPPDAQNTLLKVLEEPGANNFIILTATHTSPLLPTLLSRCHTIKSISLHTFPQNFKPLSIKTLSDSEKLIQSFNRDKIAFAKFIDQNIAYYQQLLIKSPSRQISQTITKLLKCRQMLSANVDPLTTLDYFFLT